MKTDEQVLNAVYDSTTGALKSAPSTPLTEFQTLGDQSVALSDTWLSADIEVETKSEIIIAAKVTYNSEALVGVTAAILASLDSTNFDTDAYAIFGPDFNAGDTKQKTRRADIRGIKKIRLQSENYDATFSADIELSYLLLE